LSEQINRFSGHFLPRMSRRPLIAFLAGLAPYPPPLIGSSLRISRLIRELHAEFDIALLCLSDVETDTITENWELGKQLKRIVAVPRPEPLGKRDAIWGSLASSAMATIVTSVPGQRPRLFDWAWSERLVAATRQTLRELNVEGVWATRFWTAEMARAAGAKRIIVDIDDFQGGAMVRELAESPPYKRKMLHVVQAANLVRYERRLLKRFSAVAICKQEDAALLETNAPERIHVVPNGVDLPVSVDRSRVNSGELLFVGTLSWEPNIEAMRQLVEAILPAVRESFPGATLTVAGRSPTPDHVRALLSQPHVALHESPVSLDEFYTRAAIGVAPLLRGGGTSIKVLESLAYALPTVASPVAARGLGLEDGKHLLIADSSREFAAAILHLLNEPTKARALGDAGRREVLRRFSWQAAGESARAAMRSVLESREFVA
jgi:glycosyltransferase involved in cell wall biosynthesis